MIGPTTVSCCLLRNVIAVLEFFYEPLRVINVFSTGSDGVPGANTRNDATDLPTHHVAHTRRELQRLHIAGFSRIFPSFVLTNTKPDSWLRHVYSRLAPCLPSSLSRVCSLGLASFHAACSEPTHVGWNKFFIISLAIRHTDTFNLLYYRSSDYSSKAVFPLEELYQIEVSGRRVRVVQS